MDNDAKAIGNQKAFVSLRSVLELQDRLRERERQMVSYYQQAQHAEAQKNQDSAERNHRIAAQYVHEVRAINQTIELLKLPIQTQDPQRTLNQKHA